ncbi:MAG TPA: hypothetical protein DHV36_13360 [Desulfobacteraceae bacterium]|nr:hypothetical protein [Desulfobacteraceae bacterium]
MRDPKPSYEALEKRLKETEEILEVVQRGEGDAFLSKGRYMVLRNREAEKQLLKSKAQIMQLNQNLDARVKERTAEKDVLNRRLRGMSQKLVRVERDERNKLSTLLHDHIQPLVVGARMQVWELQRNSDPEAANKTAEKLEKALADVLSALRSLSVELSPAALQNNGLSGGLNWLKTYMQEKFGFTVNLTAASDLEPLQEEAAFLLFEGVKELLLNAAKHSGASGADMLVRRTEADLISIVVADQGRGFDPAIIRDETTETATLGLFSIQERLASIDGRMLVETARGRGTKVTLTAPAGEKRHPPLPAHSDADTKQADRSIRIKGDMVGILIVDDHKVLRDGLKGLLQPEPDFHVLGEAGSGKEALELAGELSPDVILMDINLGDMHGVEVTRKILSRHPEIRVLGLSMHEDPDLIKAMYDAGACHYLTKNEPSEKIVAAIRKCMAGH